jgi:hypothetical protein
VERMTVMGGMVVIWEEVPDVLVWNRRFWMRKSSGFLITALERNLLPL